MEALLSLFSCGVMRLGVFLDPMHWASIAFAVHSKTRVSGVFPQACSTGANGSAGTYSPFALLSCGEFCILIHVASMCLDQRVEVINT